jgi:hypothetical protein
MSSKKPLFPIMIYRRETSGFSWKFRLSANTTSQLEFGQTLPELGKQHTNAETGLKVTPLVREDMLDITTGDLPSREKFDPRRVYTTPQGTAVVYKRLQNEKIILWSYKISNELAVGSGIILTRTDSTASAAAVVKQPEKLTQRILAAWLITQRPNITHGELTAELRAAFPQCLVSDRHGKHYLSHARHGRLPEPPAEDPRIISQGPTK